MVALQNLILLGLPVAIAGAALEQRAPKSPFGLYAYGDGIGGAPVFTSGRTLTFPTCWAEKILIILLHR